MKTQTEKLRNKIIKSYKRNETAGTVYRAFIGQRTREEILSAMEIMIDLARISNPDKRLRAKALGIIGFFRIIRIDVNESDPFYYGRYFSEFHEIEKIIEDNCLEITKILKEINDNELNADLDLSSLIDQVIFVLNEYTISKDVFREFYDSLMSRIEKFKLGHYYIYPQLQKINQKYYG